MPKAKKQVTLRDYLDRRFFKQIMSRGRAALDNYRVIEGLLRTFADEVFSLEDVDEIDGKARQLAKVFLGQDPAMKGNEWFGPGQIDVHVARRAGVKSDDPVERVAGGLLMFIKELIDLQSSDNTLNEQWQFQATGIVRSFAHMFMGLPEYSSSPVFVKGAK